MYNFVLYRSINNVRIIILIVKSDILLLVNLFLYKIICLGWKLKLF